MIAFDLQCENGHTFEGWFDDSDNYRMQKEEGLLSCPFCDSAEVYRLPSTFTIGSSHDGEASPPTHLDMEHLNRKIVQFVQEKFDHVGADFAKEALKMHYGVTEPRNIRGVSTPEEEKTLKDEGIEFYKIRLPSAPDSES